MASLELSGEAVPDTRVLGLTSGARELCSRRASGEKESKPAEEVLSALQSLLRLASGEQGASERETEMRE
eukprot:2996647-Rhodomonas_salina.1